MLKSKLFAFLTLSSLTLAVPGCHRAETHVEEEHHTIVATSPLVQDVVSTRQYVCQIHSCRHIEVCALEGGYLQDINVKEGQAVKQGELMFKIVPVLFQARLDAELAEVQLAQIEVDNARRLLKGNVVAQPEVALAEAKLARAAAKVALARAELSFTDVKAPFNGIVDRLHRQQGSLIDEREMLTTLSDNSLMWVYFNVPEADYFQYQEEMAASSGQASAVKSKKHDDDDDDDDKDDDKDDDDDRKVSRSQGAVQKSPRELTVRLKLANGKMFDETGNIAAIEADFNNETGNIAFRADFPNPGGKLRHGQTGNVQLERVLHNALVIPQRATFSILDKRFVYIVGEDHLVQQREIEVETELDDIFVVKSGLSVGERFVLEGVRQVHEGEAVEASYRDPQEVLKTLKTVAE